MSKTARVYFGVLQTASEPTKEKEDNMSGLAVGFTDRMSEWVAGG